MSEHLSVVPNNNIKFSQETFGELLEVYADRLGHLYITNTRGRALMMPKHTWGERIPLLRQKAERLIGQQLEVTLSQHVEPWEPQQWLYDLQQA